jgi:hypothetical protein
MKGVVSLLDAITITLELVVLFIKSKRNNRITKVSFLEKICDSSVTTQTRVTSELPKKECLISKRKEISLVLCSQTGSGLSHVQWLCSYNAIVTSNDNIVMYVLTNQ